MLKEVISTKGDRKWQGIPGIEIAPNGRLWASVYTGGSHEPHVDNHILLMTSADGVLWTEPKLAIEGDSVTRLFDPTLWHDDSGKLWLIYNLASIEKREYSVWAINTDDSSGPEPVWSEPKKLSRRSNSLLCDSKNMIFVSAASALEIATKYRIGKY